MGEYTGPLYGERREAGNDGLLNMWENVQKQFLAFGRYQKVRVLTAFKASI